jgi:hypothetical protein
VIKPAPLSLRGEKAPCPPKKKEEKVQSLKFKFLINFW